MKFDDHSADLGAATVEAGDFVPSAALLNVERRCAVHETSFRKNRGIFFIDLRRRGYAFRILQAMHLAFHFPDEFRVYAQCMRQLYYI